MSKILIVEDDRELATLYEERLLEDGHQIDHAADAYEAIQQALSTETLPDLVIMDLALQGPNGIVTGLALRGLGYAGPIIVVTGALLPVDQKLYDLVGFTGRLLKPMKLADLVAEIDRQLVQESSSE